MTDPAVRRPIWAPSRIATKGTQWISRPSSPFVFAGLQDGAIYATVAIALVLIFKGDPPSSTSHRVNWPCWGAFFVYILAVEHGWPVVASDPRRDVVECCAWCCR